MRFAGIDETSLKKIRPGNIPFKLVPVRPTDATSRPAVRCFGHIDRMAFVRLSPPDWCHLFDIASGGDLSDAVDQIDAARVCRTDAGKTSSVSLIGRDHRCC